MRLTDFLLARIAEDKAVALAADGGEDSTTHLLGFLAGSALSEGDRLAVHPARVLAECEAKRRIVEESALWGCKQTMARILALPYADHADYDGRWRP